MKILLFLAAACVALPLFAGGAKMSNVTLYQPDTVLRERIREVAPLAAFIKEIQSLCAQSLTTEQVEKLDIVVVLKPGGRSRVWFVSTMVKMPDRSKMKAEIEALEVPAVTAPLAFALTYELNGFNAGPMMAGKEQPPIPAEWRDKTKKAAGPLIIPDGFLPYVWPE